MQSNVLQCCALTQHRHLCRWVFHKAPQGYWGIYLHFMLHGCHHKYPLDVDRLVFPPVPASWLMAVLWGLLRACLVRGPALALFAGVIAGYIHYDVSHYLMHAGMLSGARKAAHMHHHYRNSGTNFGISCPWMDRLCGTVQARA